MALLDGNNDVVLLKSGSEFSVYSLKGNDICLFVVPEKIIGKLSLYLDLNLESDYTLLLQGSKTQQQIIEEIAKDYKVLGASYSNSVYVVPNFNINGLSGAMNVNDKQAIFSSISTIGTKTKEIQSVLASKGIALDSKINIVVKSEVDKKFALWLQGQNIGTGISFEELKNKNNVNPFVNNVNTSSNPFANVGESQIGTSNNVQNPQIMPENNQFAFSNNNAVGEMKQNDANLQDTKVIPVPTPVDGATLQGADLDGQTIDVNDSALENNVKKRKLGNKGYVNIVILMAVLVGVTLLSIQIGKFLYSIYG